MTWLAISLCITSSVGIDRAGQCTEAASVAVRDSPSQGTTFQVGSKTKTTGARLDSDQLKLEIDWFSVSESSSESRGRGREGLFPGGGSREGGGAKGERRPAFRELEWGEAGLDWERGAGPTVVDARLRVQVFG